MKKTISTISIVAILVMSVGFTPRLAQASALTAISDTMSTVKKNTLSSHIIKFTTPTGANESTDTIIITFPSDFNFTSKAINTLTFTHGATTGAENTEMMTATPGGITWGAVFSGTQNRILTLTAPTDGVGAAAIAASDKIILTYDSTNSTNPTTAASYTVSISGTFGDTGSYLVTVLDDDQVAVSATVAEILTFSISDNSIGFGTLSSSAARFASSDATGSATEVEAHTLIAGTNATSGYTVTVKGATLTSGANTITAIGAVNTASSPTSEQFGLRMDASGGSGTVTAPYADVGFAYAADGSTADEVASSGAVSASTTYSVRYLANITALTQAGSYTATLTYIATANY